MWIWGDRRMSGDLGGLGRDGGMGAVLCRFESERRSSRVLCGFERDRRRKGVVCGLGSDRFIEPEEAYMRKFTDINEFLHERGHHIDLIWEAFVNEIFNGPNKVEKNMFQLFR
jgi:hypothetical protein